ncbi:MAG: DUF1585 domain-containing protein [Planctomycetaceae bacterium]
MDGIGTCLEGSDRVGRRRACYTIDEIDLLGEFSDGTELYGEDELREWLLDHQSEFARAYTEALYVYALGRPLRLSERMRAWDLADEHGPQYRTTDILRGVIASELFQTP